LEPEYKAWGIAYNPAFQRAPDYQCQNCGWEFVSPYIRREITFAAMVGFSPDMPTHPNKPKCVGILILECPDCFEKFWFHTTKEWLELLEDFKKNK
jgi:hypothetical protein